jgi:hypothetical protein
MPRQYTRRPITSDEDFINAVKSSFSIAEALRKMGLSPYGGSYKQFKLRVDRLQIDTSHFTGAGHLKGKKHNWSKKTPLEELLIENSTRVMDSSLKKRIVNDGLLPHKCAICGLENIWQGLPITLHIDHINGNPFDHRIENLRFLCPNCHSQTPNFGAKNRNGKTSRKNERDGKQSTPRVKRVNHCELCGNETSAGKFRYCGDCYRTRRKELQTPYDRRTKIVWPPVEELLLRLETISCVQLGKELGVTDSSIRRYIKNHRKDTT